MDAKQLIFIVVLFLCPGTCRNAVHKIDKENLPRDLNEALTYLDNNWNSFEKLKFKNQPEAAAVTSIHFSTGLWIRNNWIYGDRAPSLVTYFHKIGIYSPDDISSIILTSFHRQLNHKPLDINAQIQPYKLYWKSIHDCEEISKKKAILNYHKFDIGKPIVILMPVDTAVNERNAVAYDCPQTDWKFNPQKDLMINGVVTEKYFINDSANVFFKVKIKQMNYPNTSIFMDAVKIGSVVAFSLEHLTIK